MAKDIFLRIAEIAIGLTCNLIESEIQLKGAIEKFLVRDVEPDIKIEVCWDELHEESQGKKIFDSGTTWRLYDHNGSYLIRLTAPVFGPIPYKEALFTPDFSTGEIRLHRPFYSQGQSVDPLEYPLDELLIVHYLSRRKGVEVHAFGMVDPQGNGHLFLGQSGAGKSTMARLWKDQPGTTALSDDRIILRPAGENYWMHGTPWHGDAGLAYPGCSQVRGVYFLQKGLDNELIPLERTEALGRLFACCFPPFYSKEAIGFILDFLEGMVNTVPCYELRFLPDRSLVGFINSRPYMV